MVRVYIVAEMKYGGIYKINISCSQYDHKYCN